MTVRGHQSFLINDNDAKLIPILYITGVRDIIANMFNI